MDAALMEKCADPALAPAIVEQFVAAIGSDDPLAVTVKADGRLVLIPKPKSPEDALATVREYVGHAVVSVGMTQFPAGIGTTDPSKLQSTMFDPCENLRTGTALFAKVARIVTKWYGRPTNKELLPQMLDDALYAWKTGHFEGVNVFRAEDPGGPTFFGKGSGQPLPAVSAPEQEAREADGGDAQATDAAGAGMRIDLSRIGGQK